MDSFFRFHKFHKNQEKNFKTKKDFLDLCRINILKSIKSTNKNSISNLKLCFVFICFILCFEQNKDKLIFLGVDVDAGFDKER